MICSNCNYSELKETDRFCRVCGSPLASMVAGDSVSQPEAANPMETNRCQVDIEQKGNKLGDMIGLKFEQKFSCPLSAASPLGEQWNPYKIKIGEIIELVNILSKIAITEDMLNDAFRRSLPERAGKPKQRLTIVSAVEHLYDISARAKEPLPLITFAEIIADHIKTEDIAGELKTWIAETIAETGHDYYKKGDIHRTEKKKTAPLHLLVKVAYAPTNPANDEKKLTVEVYSWKSGEPVLCLYKPGIRSKPEDDENGDVFESYEPSEIPHVMGEIIGKAMNHPKIRDDDNIHRIEFIFPYELIHFDADQWKKVELGEIMKLKFYRIVMRIDRYKLGHTNIRNECRQRWKEKWKEFNDYIKKQTGDECILWQCDHTAFDVNDVFETLFNPFDPQTCLMMTHCPGDGPDIEKFGKKILLYGIPVALWCRKPGTEIGDHEALKKEMAEIVENGNLKDLPDLVYKERLNKRESGLGKNLTLLWDDPNIKIGTRN